MLDISFKRFLSQEGVGRDGEGSLVAKVQLGLLKRGLLQLLVVTSVGVLWRGLGRVIHF
jgi:hypothetical protein